MRISTVRVVATAGLAALAIGAPAPAFASGPGSRPLTVFRVDVSRYPQVGLIVTVPWPAARDARVMIGARTVRARLNRLWPSDVQLVLALDTDLAPAAMRTEQAAAAKFVVDLPRGAQTAVGGAGALTRDPAAAVAAIGMLAHSARPHSRQNSAATRMGAALAAVAAGPRLRRTGG